MKDISSFFGWKWEGLSFELPTSILLEMKATPLPFSNQGKDWISWYSSLNGEFKPKEAYHLANWDDNNKTGQTFKWGMGVEGAIRSKD